MKLGFIGCGNMATAMMKGIIGNQIVAKEDIIGADLSKESLTRIQKDLGINVTSENREVTKNADILVLSVKPQFYESVIQEIKDVVTDTQLIVTIA